MVALENKPAEPVASPCLRRSHTPLSKLEQLQSLTDCPTHTTGRPPTRSGYNAQRTAGTGDRSAGAERPINHASSQLAATALSRGASVAIKEVDDFEGVRSEVINPWENG